jgi:UDPglucose 6-dehydrogenase
MNEVANLCELLGADVDSVRKGIGTDSRIGNRFLFAGIGYGGSCFPKDVQALAKSSEGVDYDFQILNSVMNVNKTQKQKMIDPIKNYFNGDLNGKTIAVWGLAFKPYTDDIREAPALENINSLLDLGADIRTYDPEAMENVKEVLEDSIYFANDQYDALDSADALVIMTEWPIFRTPEFDRMQKALNNNVIFDGRNLYDLGQMKELGFEYYSVGRRTVK